MHPTEIVLTKNATALAITWEDGSASQLTAATLRRASRAASEVRREADGLDLRLPEDLQVSAVEPIGNYAIRLSFSDGHERGIYPWGYLRALAGAGV